MNKWKLFEVSPSVKIHLVKAGKHKQLLNNLFYCQDFETLSSGFWTLC